MLPLLYHLIQGGAGVTGAKSSDSMGVGQGTPWTSRQLIAGPLLMAVAATKVLRIRSNLGFSILLKDTSACSSSRGARDLKWRPFGH